MTQPKFNIKKGDMVEVITGKEKGKRGTVQRILMKDSKLLIEGVNQVTRFLKATQQNPNGPVQKNLPLHISNVALIDPSTNKPGRVGIRVKEDGSKERFFKKSGSTL
jgi:large subunit ribosomal protein L24